MLVSLPYRVGLLVSQSDDVGGEDSDAKEKQALGSLLSGYAGEIFVSETVQYILTETMKRREEWPKWSGNLTVVLDDCGQAVELLRDQVDEKEVSAFKQHLMEIAEAVAVAFREVEDLTFVDKLKMKIKFLKLEYQAKKQGHTYKTYDEFLNISPKEREVLEKIASTLKINYAI